MVQKTKSTAAKKAKPAAKSGSKSVAAKSTKAKPAAKSKATSAVKAATKSTKVKQQAPKSKVKKIIAPKTTAPKTATTKSASAKAKAPATSARTSATTRKAAAKVAPSKAAKPVESAKKAPVEVKKRAVAAAKPSGQKVSAPVVEKTAAAGKAAAKPVATKSQPVAPATPRDIAAKTRDQVNAAPPAAPKRPVGQRHGFKTNEYVVYPAHGVGQIVSIEEQEIAGMTLELFVITFDKDKLTLRVPTGKSESVGMRKLADGNIVTRALETLKGRARIKRTMWSRRAQEYEAKINSGDLISIAEVVRDLYRSESQPEQSYSERQLYEAALDRMAREIAAVDKLDDRGAVQKITEILSKSAKGRRAAAEAVEAEEEAKAA